MMERENHMSPENISKLSLASEIRVFLPDLQIFRNFVRRIWCKIYVSYFKHVP
jgi:hypothetical protein